MDRLLFLLLTGYAVTSVAGQCGLPADPNECPRQQLSGGRCCTWNTIYNNESIYDTEAKSLDDTLCRPYGFAYATWYYQKPQSVNQPCVSLTCPDPSSACWVQISVETSPPGSLCVKDNQGGQASCGEGSFNLCFRMKAPTVEYIFECQTGCGESSVTFWYRMNTFTPQPGQDGNDLCTERTVHFPSFLAQLPDDKDPQNKNPILEAPTQSSATTILPTFASILTSLLLLVFVV